MSRALCNLILKDLKSLESRYKLKKGPQAHSPRKLRIRCKQQIKSLALRYKLKKINNNSISSVRNCLQIGVFDFSNNSRPRSDFSNLPSEEYLAKSLAH